MKKDIKKDILQKIEKGEVKMRSKEVFVLEKMLIFFGVVLAIVSSVFLFNLVFYLPRRAMMMGGRPNILQIIPYDYLMFGIAFLILGIFLLRKYTREYKRPIVVTVLLISVISIALSLVLSYSAINRQLENRPGIMKNMYRKGQLEKRFNMKNEINPKECQYYGCNGRYKK